MLLYLFVDLVLKGRKQLEELISGKVLKAEVWRGSARGDGVNVVVECDGVDVNQKMLDMELAVRKVDKTAQALRVGSIIGMLSVMQVNPRTGAFSPVTLMWVSPSGVGGQPSGRA